MRISLLLAMAIGASLIGSKCGGSAVGDPCVPEDEYLTAFNGFAQQEVNIESRSFQCQTRVCLVNHFQGRASCPYGQVEDPDAKGSGLSTCMGTTAHRDSDDCLPGGVTYEKSCQVPDRDGARWEDRIAVPVSPQFKERTAETTVYCSCRCGGEGDPKTFCDCPSNYTCTSLVDDIGQGKGQLAGSYCIKKDTEWDPGSPARIECDPLDDINRCDSDFTYQSKDGSLGRNQDSSACLPSGATCEKGKTTCCGAPQNVPCTDTEINGQERSCNGTCTAEGKCRHVEGDPTTDETIKMVPLLDCPSNKICK